MDLNPTLDVFFATPGACRGRNGVSALLTIRYSCRGHGQVRSDVIGADLHIHAAFDISVMVSSAAVVSLMKTRTENATTYVTNSVVLTPGAQP